MTPHGVHGQHSQKYHVDVISIPAKVWVVAQRLVDDSPRAVGHSWGRELGHTVAWHRGTDRVEADLNQAVVTAAVKHSSKQKPMV